MPAPKQPVKVEELKEVAPLPELVRDEVKVDESAIPAPSDGTVAQPPGDADLDIGAFEFMPAP